MTRTNGQEEEERLTGDHPDPPERLPEVPIPSDTCNFQRTSKVTSPQIRGTGRKGSAFLMNQKDLEPHRGARKRQRRLGGEAHGPAREPTAPARRRPFFLTMKLTPTKAEEATARSAPLRLAAKRSPPASVVAGLIVRRRAAGGAFEAGLPLGGSSFLYEGPLYVCLVLTGDAHDGVGNRTTEGEREKGGGEFFEFIWVSISPLTLLRAHRPATSSFVFHLCFGTWR